MRRAAQCERGFSILFYLLFAVALFLCGFAIFLARTAPLSEGRVIFQNLENLSRLSMRIDSEEFSISSPAPGSLAGERWRFEKAPGTLVSQYVLGKICSALQDLKPLRVIPLNSDLSAAQSELSSYGLVTPHAEMVLHLDGKDMRLLFGSANDFLSGRYMIIAGTADVLLISENDAEKILRTREELIDDRMAPFEIDEVSAAVFDLDSAQRIDLERISGADTKSNKASWLVNKQAADVPFVEEFLRKLSSARLRRFLSPAERCRAQPNFLKASIKFRENKELTIVVGTIEATDNNVIEPGNCALLSNFASAVEIDKEALRAITPRLEVLLPGKEDVSKGL